MIAALLTCDLAPRLGWYLLADGAATERVELLAVEVTTGLCWPRWASLLVAAGMADPVDVARVEVGLVLVYRSREADDQVWRMSREAWLARRPQWVGPSYRQRPAEAWS